MHEDVGVAQQARQVGDIPGDLGAGRIPHRELGDLDEARLDRVRQTKVGHDPGKGPIGVLPHAPQEIGRRREVRAEVDATQLVDAVEAFYPDRRFVEQLLGLVLILEEVGPLLLLGPE